MTNFNLGKLLQINEIKNIDGEIGFSDFIIKEDDIQISGINAKFNKLQALDYSYSSISISGAKLEKNIFDGKVAVNDKNLSLDYTGKIGFGKSTCESVLRSRCNYPNDGARKHPNGINCLCWICWIETNFSSDSCRKAHCPSQ
jgi:hypothetical protein